jgi:SGNH hydrolase-like domain, acetyltransferase AlgX
MQHHRKSRSRLVLRLSHLALGSVVSFASIGMAGCQSSARSPWHLSNTETQRERADVQTLNSNYQRVRSTVLVRQIKKPTRAALDYAAYSKNFMIADLAPEQALEFSAEPDTTNPFKGLVERASLTGDIRSLPLSSEEWNNAVSLAPATEYLANRQVHGADLMQQVNAGVRDEWWGFPRLAGFAPQSISDLYIHQQGEHAELWVKIEFAPWFKGLGDLSDQDRDGFPEVYGKISSDHVSPEVVAALRGDYSTVPLSTSEIKLWFNQLSSYWYPSFNTDLIAAGPSWPDAKTEPDIREQLAGKTFAKPSFVLRGKPQGQATYAVFLVDGYQACSGDCVAAAGTGVQLPPTKAKADTSGAISALQRELSDHGGLAHWVKQTEKFTRAARTKLKQEPQRKAFAGRDGFLFFRNSLTYLAGGNLTSQRPGKNPLPVIVEFKQALAAKGVDFLFVPVPTKEEVFPGHFDRSGKDLVGKVVNPFGRQFLLELSQAGVEVVDLLPRFLAETSASPGGTGELEPLYQRQDTHWTDRGLRLAAKEIAERIKRYAWFPMLAPYSSAYRTQATSFTRFGDLHSRLPEREQQRYKPEVLQAQQVLSADGKLYEDTPSSPIVVLGDSFTGVYELTDAEHAGVSAHVAAGISHPVDLVMSYGGGPNVRNKLMSRGKADLSRKKLVIWMMTARDLYDYWEDWEALADK